MQETEICCFFPKCSVVRWSLWLLVPVISWIIAHWRFISLWSVVGGTATRFRFHFCRRNKRYTGKSFTPVDYEWTDGFASSWSDVLLFICLLFQQSLKRAQQSRSPRNTLWFLELNHLFFPQTSKIKVTVEGDWFCGNYWPSHFLIRETANYGKSLVHDSGECFNWMCVAETFHSIFPTEKATT